jgi:hypothetical protein
VTESLRTLLAGLIDYAGLFPPAKLPLEQALPNYARYRGEPQAWMLGRFIIPATQLGDLERYRPLFQGGPPFALSVLGPSESSWAECRAPLEAVLRDLKEVGQRLEGRVVADALEMKVPADLVDASDPRTTARGLQRICGIVASLGLSRLTVCFEWGLEGGNEAVATVIEAVALANRHAPPRAAFKLRCGGLTASAFPTAEQIAFVLRTAVMNGVPLKATAGLHHPLPRFDAGVRARMHGFVNVFAAGVLGFARHLEPDTLVKVLNDDDPAHFAFDAAGFRYGVSGASTAEIAAARADAVLSFGSCSFDEPRDDLRALGWL